SACPKPPYSSFQSPAVRSASATLGGISRGDSRNWNTCFLLIRLPCHDPSPACGGGLGWGHGANEERMRPSRRTPQFFGQRFQARGLGLHQPELAQVVADVVEDSRTPGAAGVVRVQRQQVAQVLAVVV